MDSNERTNEQIKEYNETVKELVAQGWTVADITKLRNEAPALFGAVIEIETARRNS